MATYTIKGGLDAVTVKTDEHGILIEYGMDAINATIGLDYEEAQELAGAIIEGAETWAGPKLWEAYERMIGDRQ